MNLPTLYFLWVIFFLPFIIHYFEKLYYARRLAPTSYGTISAQNYRLSVD